MRGFAALQCGKASPYRKHSIEFEAMPRTPENKAEAERSADQTVTNRNSWVPELFMLRNPPFQIRIIRVNPRQNFLRRYLLIHT